MQLENVIAGFRLLSVPPDVRELVASALCPAWRKDTRARWDRETFEEERHHQWGVPTSEMLFRRR